jgi:hypothetical protein
MGPILAKPEALAASDAVNVASDGKHQSIDYPRPCLYPQLQGGYQVNTWSLVSYGCAPENHKPAKPQRHPEVDGLPRGH